MYTGLNTACILDYSICIGVKSKGLKRAQDVKKYKDIKSSNTSLSGLVNTFEAYQKVIKLIILSESEETETIEYSNKKILSIFFFFFFQILFTS